MFNTVRQCHQQCFKKVCFYIRANKFSVKVSKAVKLPPHNDSISKASNYEKTCVQMVQLLPKKEPMCTTLLSKNSVSDEWEVVTTNWKNVHLMYLKLSKIRLTTLVVVTTMAGYALATAPFDLNTFLFCCLGTGLVSSAANAINQYHEVPFDAQMKRTKNRVLVKGNLSPLHALGFAAVSGISGLSILYLGCNSLTALLGASNLILYSFIYTPMKRMSILNTWVGSIVGAIPPMMGWASCTGYLEPGAWLLAAILYAWQFPHFNALSWNLRPDYSKAGYRMMAVTNPGFDKYFLVLILGLCRRTALRYTAAITVLCFFAPTCDITNDYFLFQMLPLNIYFTYLAFRFYRESDSANSRKLFKFSLIHLPTLIVLMLFNKRNLFVSSDPVTNLTICDNKEKFMQSDPSLLERFKTLVSVTKFS